MCPVAGYAVRKTGMSANDDAVRSRRVEKEILMSPKRCLSGALSGQYWENGFYRRGNMFLSSKIRYSLSPERS